MACSISEFFTGQSILVTGATGFLGKAIVEKLLRSCPDIDTIYILIRPKPGNPDIRTRIEKLLDNSLFDTIKATNPGILTKIHPICGDIGLPSLGLNKSDKHLLTSNVTIVIHSAATVKFDEELPISVNLNINGLWRVVKLCKEIAGLKSLVHISTAYANCNETVIEEKVYLPPHGTQEILKYLYGFQSKTATFTTELTESVKKARPNTYTYTKAIAEYLLTLEAYDLPVCIVRPSIVTASFQEPVTGWVDNLNGATGALSGLGCGAIRTLLLDPDLSLNYVPVDMTVNLILCAAWQTAKKEERSDRETIPVYNSCTPPENLLTNGKQCALVIDIFRQTFPLSKAIMYPACVITKNRFLYMLNDLCFQYIPATAMELFSEGKNSPLAMYRRMKRQLAQLEYFTTNNWKFITENSKGLQNALGTEDEQLFNFQMDKLDGQDYLHKFCLGIRRHIFKESDSTLIMAQEKVKILYERNNFLKFFIVNVLLFAFVWLVIQFINICFM